jgi:hypothetical protein
MEGVIAKTEPLGSRIMPAHRVGRRWMFKQDEVDEWGRSGGAADKTDKPDTEQ